MKQFPGKLFFFWNLIIIGFSIPIISSQSHAKDNFNYNKWYTLYKKNPSNNLYRFNLAVTYQKMKKKSKAKRLYLLILKTKSKLKPVALYYLAQIEFNEGNEEKAKNYIDKIQIDRLPNNLKARILGFKNKIYAKDFKDSINDSESKGNLNGTLRVAIGYNSNPTFVAINDSSESEEDDNQTVFDLYLNYLAQKSSSFDWFLSFSSFSQIYLDQTDSNFDSLNLKSPVSYYFSNWRVRISPGYNFDTYSGQAFSSGFKGEADISYKVSNNYLSTGFAYDQVDIINQDSYFYLDGSIQTYYVSWRYVDKDFLIAAKQGLSIHNYQDSDTISPSYEAMRSSINLQYKINSSELGLYGLYESRVYSFDVVEDDTRKDQRISIVGSYIYFLDIEWSIFGSARYSINSSNFDETTTDDKNYTQTVFNIGFKFYF